MTWWPRGGFEYHTPLPPELAFSVLKAQVAPFRWFASSDEPFTGTVRPDRFRIEPARCIHVFTSPVFVGALEPRGEVHRVRVRWRLQRWAEVALASLVLGALVLCVLAVRRWLQLPPGTPTSPVLLAPAGFLAVLLLLVNWVFGMEVARHERLLRALLGVVD
jgi:hypothetical protein